jgi:very-short-patch-repair endonuclease/predicted transcriptional regulator of viral defense system
VRRMTDERMEALALRQHGLITFDQAITAGLTESGIRHRRSKRRLVEVHPRVYRLAGAIDTPNLRAHAAVLAAGADAAISHTSAAALYRLPGFTIDPVVLTIPRRWSRSLAGVGVEQSLAMPPHHCRVVEMIPCTSLARTLFDLCGTVRARRAERALDTALARRAITLPALWRVFVDLAEHGRAGTVVMRTLLMARGTTYVPPASELEARFVELARAQGLEGPQRQVDLGDADSWIGRVDFLFRSARLVVEVDSAEFHDGMLDRDGDAERDRRLESDGWTVLRFRWRDVVDRPEFVARSIRFRYAIAPS